MASPTEDELELLDLAVSYSASSESDYDTKRRARFWELRRKCARERLSREDPEWKQRITAAHGQYQRARSAYNAALTALEKALGEEDASLIEIELNRGDAL